MADDDHGVRMVAESMLKKVGYTVLTAVDGKEAIQKWDKHIDEIDLTMLDVVMPKLGGKAVFDYIREVRPESRILFASGYSAEGIHSSFVLAKSMQLIRKPYKRDALLRKVRDLLDS